MNVIPEVISYTVSIKNYSFVYNGKTNPKQKIFHCVMKQGLVTDWYEMNLMHEA